MIACRTSGAPGFDEGLEFASFVFGVEHGGHRESFGVVGGGSTFVTSAPAGEPSEQVSDVSLTNGGRGKHVGRSQNVGGRHHGLLSGSLGFEEQAVAQVAERAQRDDIGSIPGGAGVGGGEMVQHLEMGGAGQPDLAVWGDLEHAGAVGVPLRMTEMAKDRGGDLQQHVGHEVAVACFGNGDELGSVGQCADGDSPRT